MTGSCLIFYLVSYHNSKFDKFGFRTLKPEKLILFITMTLANLIGGKNTDLNVESYP